MIKKVNRLEGLDLLKFISIICVLFIHVVGNTIYTFNLDDINALKFYHTIEYLSYFSISLFVLISGYLFLKNKKDIEIKQFFKNHVLKIILIIIIFGFIEGLLEYSYINNEFSFSYIVPCLKNIVTGYLWDHMWFLYMILGIYILTPAIKIYFDNASKNNILILLIILFIFSMLFPLLKSLFDIYIAFEIPVTSAYLFCFILGGYIGKYNINKYLKYLLYILSIIYLILPIINYYFNEINLGLWVNYTSILSISFSMFLMILLKDIKIKNNSFKKIITSISSYSLGIYVIHQFYINIIYKYLELDYILNFPYIGLFVYVFVILVITYITVYIFKKSKIVDKYLL